jgi:homoserine O-acetyltransferase
MPAEKDLYFPPEDNAWEVERMPNAELRVIPGVWGHFAGGGANPVDTGFIDRGLKDLLSTLVRAEPDKAQPPVRC